MPATLDEHFDQPNGVLAGARVVLAELDDVVMDPLGVDEPTGNVVGSNLASPRGEPDGVLGEPVEPAEAVEAVRWTPLSRHSEASGEAVATSCFFE